MRRFWHNNGLSLTMLGLSVVFLGGHAAAGFLEFTNESAQHGQSALSFAAYLANSHFLESVFENWESEFLQMGLYVLLTAFLFQKGSAESNDPSQPEKETPLHSRSPWPVRRGGVVAKWYRHSLSLALLTLFALSFIGHAMAGHQHNNTERLVHAQAQLSLGQYVVSSRFWFESFQNWQSEFVSVFALVTLSIWLREAHSPESKPLTAPHSSTGS